MKHGDYYHHYKDVEYYFDCIAIPLKDARLSKYVSRNKVKVPSARYHEDTHDLDLYVFEGITFINSDVPHVIYQSEKDYDTDRIYAREVDNFFGVVDVGYNEYEKRFALKRK